MKFTFKETKDYDLELDFQKIYDYIKNSISDYNYNKWDIHNDFGDNMDYYIKEIYGYNIEDNEYNDYLMDTIFKEWSNWIEKIN